MSLPIPSIAQVREAPELSALVNLRASLDVTEHTLLAVHPKLEGDHSRPTWQYLSGREAYACALVHQVRALSASVDELIQDLQGIADRNLGFSIAPF